MFKKKKNMKALSWILMFALLLSNVIGLSKTNVVKADGTGSWDSPYTVAQAIATAVQDNRIASVQGYIVGQPTGTTAVIASNFTADTAIALADNPGETDTSKMIYVQIPTGSFRTSFGLKTNPSAMGTLVKSTGNLTPYYTPHPGLKSITSLEKVATTIVILRGFSLPNSAEVEEGKTIKLALTYDPVDTTEKDVDWTPGDATIATVSADGTVTGIKEGSTTITATSNVHSNISATVTVTVKSPGDTVPPVITNLDPAEDAVIDLSTTVQGIRVEYNDGSGVGIDTSNIKLSVDGTDVASFAAITSGSISYTASDAFTSGTHTAVVEVSDKNGNKTTKTWSFSIGAATPIQYNLYYGQLHSHTSLSDGLGTPAEAFTYARDTAGADYVAITDHSNWFDDEKNTANENITDVSQSTSNEWKEIRNTADQYTENGRFVAIGAFEMTWSGSTGGWGHINTFNTPWFASRSNSSMDLKAYYNKLAQPENSKSISQLNHPGKTFGDFSDFGFYRADADNVVNLIEVGNGEGQVRNSGYFPSYEYYTRALDKGWHVAPTNNQDNHKGKFVNANTTRTVILSQNLTRDSLYDAMRNRRVYATEDENLDISYTVNDKPMGTILSNPGDLIAKININDPDATDVIGKVSIIVDGGAVAASKVFDTNTAEWDLTLPAGYKYYYVRVDEGDKDIAVTAPVWAGSVVPVGISKLEVSQDPQIVNNPEDITATVYNNGTSALSNVKVEFFKETIDTEHKIGEATLSSVDPSSTGSAKISWTPTTTGQIKLYAKTVVNIGGQDNVFTQTTTFDVSNPQDLVKVVIDGGHQNQYVSGDYSGKMLTLASMLRDKKFMLVQNNDELTSSDLENAKILIITDPQGKAKTGPPALSPQKYTDAEIQAVNSFVAKGGNLIITSRADYDDKGITDRTYQSSVQGNTVLEAIGSNLRFNDDEVIDDASNGGQNYRLYFEDYTGSKYHLTDNLVAGETYSAYSGCSVVLKDNGDDSKVDWLVKGHDTTASFDSDLQNDAVQVAKGNVYSIAAEVLPNGSKVIVAGTTFFSDFETASSDNAYSNKDFTDNVINWMTEPIPAELKTIAEVRADLNKDGIPDNLGLKYAIEGTVTAQSEAVSPKNAFFEVIYVQDETGGITVFGVSQTPLQIGQKVRITGYVDQYGGDTELQINNEFKDVQIIDTEINPVDPMFMTTGDSMLDENEGWLAQIFGEVTRIEGQNIYVDDGTGEARAYVEGYIGDGSGNEDTRGKWDPAIKVGDTVTIVGLASEDPDGHRLRVRNTSEIVKIDVTPPVINVTGVEESKFYNHSVTPVVSVDRGIFIMALNGEEYNGEEITADGKYDLEILALSEYFVPNYLKISFTIDTTKPVITVTGVENNGQYNHEVTPLVTVNDSEATVTKELTLAGQTVPFGKVVQEGSYNLKVTATDKAGNKSETTVTFTIDKTAPVITVEGVEDGKTYTNTSITPRITIGEGVAPTTLTLDGKDYNGTDKIKSLGTHVLVISAVDRAGNKSEKRITFTLNAAITTDTDSVAETIKDLVTNSKPEEKIVVSAQENPVISAGIFDAVKGIDKPISFTVETQGMALTWTFNGKDVTDNNTSVDLRLNAVAPTKDTIVKIDSNAQIISFVNHGILPAPMVVTIPVDTAKFDVTKPLYFYYYNETTKKAELVADGIMAYKKGDAYFVDVTLTHNSDYFLSANNNAAISQNVEKLVQTGSPIDMNSLVGLGVILVVIGCVVMFVRRRKLQ